MVSLSVVGAGANNVGTRANDQLLSTWPAVVIGPARVVDEVTTVGRASVLASDNQVIFSEIVSEC